MHIRWMLCALFFSLLAGCDTDAEQRNTAEDATPTSEGIDDPGGSNSPARPLVDASIGGPVVDYGPSAVDLSGTPCEVERPALTEFLDLTDPRLDLFTLWIPANVCHPRCVILRPYIGDHHIKDHTLPHLEHATRTLAERHACAVLTGDYEWPFHNASSRKSGPSTETALTTFAQNTSLPELATAPIVTLGFGGDPSQFTSSLAQYMPERVAAVAAWGSDSMPNTTPALYFDGRLRLTNPFPDWHNTKYIPARQEHLAPIGIAIDPLVGHNWGNTKKLGLRYLDHLLALRLEPGVAAATSPLRPINPLTGWVGHNLTLEIAPATADTLQDPNYSWLPDEAFASIWQQFMRTGQTHPNDADYPRNQAPTIDIPPPPTPEGNGSADAPYGTSTQGYAGHDIATPPPTLTPRLLVSTLIGGPGDQFIRDVGFDPNTGEVFGIGEGFRVVYDLTSLEGRIEGEPHTHDTAPFHWRTTPVTPPGNQLLDHRTQTTYSVGYRQTGGTEQTPFLHSSDGWKMWDHDDPLGDQRGSDIWQMPNGMIGFRGDSKAAHGGVLELDPFDRSKPMPDGVFEDAWQKSAATSGSVVFLIDPSVPAIVSGTWMRSFSGFQAVDHWGRLYMTTTEDDRFDADNPFRMHHAGNAGLFVLDPQLRGGRFNAVLGGVCEGGTQALRKIAIQKNILVIAGTTCAQNLAVTSNAVQREAGGGQDGIFFVIELWEQK